MGATTDDNAAGPASTPRPRPWQIVVAAKREAQEAIVRSFRPLQGVQIDDEITAIDTGITDISDASTLAAAIAVSRWTAVAVTEAYIRRAIKAHEQTNCFTEIMFADAIAQAQELDRHLARTGKTLGPLHGLPVTLKDQFDVKDHDTTLGYVGRAFSPAQADSTLVAILKSMGAVTLGKTNIPQSIMWCETDNPLFGLTTNPVHKDYTPGGSTGGEAALLSCEGSMLGWGTDIGGSVRIPSHMMGLYGFKPSSGRLPYRGVQVSTDGQKHVPSSIGPMARSLDTIQMAMKALIDAKPWQLDARCMPIPWRQDTYDAMLSRPLVIGVLMDDGVVRPHPPVTRVLEKAVEALRSIGHTIIEWDASLHAEAIQVMDAYYTADGCEDIRRAVEAGGEPYIQHVERLIARGSAISVYEYWQLNKRKKAVQNAYLDKWQSKKVDVLLTPPMPHAAVPHGCCRWVGYTKVWNLLDYTALVIPAGNVGEGESEELFAYGTPGERGELDDWNQKLWGEKGAEMAQLNLPVGVQIVGQRLEEEKVLAVGKVLDDLLRARRACW
ncbi:acetamidase [Microdochium bolleyi]|uniref:Acetamidase n=1 Tax=Microdochium bolleyi TaxID=196109 RepID=A0A136IWK8_9PEZI|nr:acetamidase [Microdochium bolleyi]